MLISEKMQEPIQTLDTHLFKLSPHDRDRHVLRKIKEVLLKIQNDEYDIRSQHKQHILSDLVELLGMSE